MRQVVEKFQKIQGLY